MIGRIIIQAEQLAYAKGRGEKKFVLEKESKPGQLEHNAQGESGLQFVRGQIMKAQLLKLNSEGLLPKGFEKGSDLIYISKTKQNKTSDCSVLL